jgi:transposase
MDLFDEAVTEIEDNGLRYVARRNPYMAKRSGANRLSKIDCLKQKTSDANTYINDHSKAKTETQIKNISVLISKFKLNKCIAIKETSNQQLDLVVDQNVLKEMEKLDGCYVLKTDLDSKKMSKENIHARYKDLAMVEHAFRTMKTSVLEVRPIYVRKKSRTRGHVFATMLAYMITQYFWNQVKELGHTLDFSIECVNDIKTTFLILGKKTIKTIPTLSPLKIGILNALNISLPKTIPV